MGFAPPALDTLEPEQFTPPPISALEPAEKFTPPPASAIDEEIPPDVLSRPEDSYVPAQHPIAENAAAGLLDAARGLVPTSMHEFEKMLNPLETAIPQIANAAGAVRDWIGGGKSADEIAKERFPESQVLVNADKTPPYSRERFAAGFNTLAQIGMLAAGGRGERAAVDRARVIPAEIVFDEVIPPGGRPAERLALPAPEAQPPVTTPDVQTATPPAVEVVPEGGGIPIEGLEEFAPAQNAAAAQPIAFRDDPNLSAARKIQLDDAARAAGLPEEQIANLTQADAAALEAAQYRKNLAAQQQQQSGSLSAATDRGAEAPPTLAEPPTPEELARMEYEQSLVDDASAYQQQTGDELHQAIIDSGGLPSKTSEARAPFAGELDRIESAVRNPQRSERLPDTLKLFRKDAPDVDELATRLRDRGFDVQTPADLLQLAEDRYTTGRQVYGIPEREQVFASGSAAPRRQPNATLKLHQLGPESGIENPREGRWRAIENSYVMAKAAQDALPGVPLKDVFAIHVLDRSVGRPGAHPDVAVRFIDRANYPTFSRELEKEFPAARYSFAVRANHEPYTPRKGEPSYKEWLAGKRPDTDALLRDEQARYERKAEDRKAADQAAAAKRIADDPQGRLFASGTAAPRARSAQAQAMAGGAAQPRPHAPSPPPRPPAPPPHVPNAAAASAVAPVQSWWQQRTLGIRKIVAPQTIDAPARMVANIIRDHNGQLANKIAIADHALAAARKSFDRTPVPRNWKYDPNVPLPRNYAFMAESERGGAGLSPDDLKLKTQLDKMFEEAVDEVHRVKPAALKSLIQDYFPHIWEDPDKARNAFASIVGGRPLEGPKGFLKQRTLAYVEDGLKAGLRPISDNPIDVVLTKLHEVHRFVAAQDMLTEAKAIGARKFVYIFEKAPEGWVKVEDPTSTVHGPPFVTVPEAFDEQMRVKTIELLDSLGVPHERLASLGKSQRWGEASNARNPANNLEGNIRTKFAGPLSVYWHELGHVLEFRYKWLDEIAPLRRYPKGYDGQIVERQRDNFGGKSVIEEELRRLADLRSSQQPPKASFKSYIRSRDEKAAVLLEAYVHAPQRMQQVAPHLYNRVRKFIAAHPELAAIEEIRPSLVIGGAKQQIPVGGMVTLGHYYMPEGAAQVFNNYLSPGIGRNGIIRALRESQNRLSAFQLGFSAFHAGYTSLDAMANQLTAALVYTARGDLRKAAGRAALTPLAPTMNYYVGKAMQAAMVDPNWSGKVRVGFKARGLGYDYQLSPAGKAAAENYARLAVQAGLRATVDPFWKTQATRNFLRAWRLGGVEAFKGTILHAPFVLSEQAMRPILEALVPRQKLGVFAVLAKTGIDALPVNADIHAVRDVLARAADSTEDRLGMMTYDNLFYNKAMRDVALLSFRAYGWQLGKMRATYGAVYDAATVRARLKNNQPAVTDRMVYPIALVAVVAGIGSLMTYLMTGKAPQSWRDALMVNTGKLDRNGNPQRLSLPSILKDHLALAFAGSSGGNVPLKIWQEFYHRLRPDLAIAVDILNNADFYHTKIYNEDDPWWKRDADKVLYAIGAARPFTVTSTQKLQESKPTLAQQVLPFFGFVPAKQELSMTPAQIRAAELYRETQPQGARTAEEANHGKLFSQLVRDMKDADPNWQTSLTKGLQSGQLRATDIPRVLQSLPLNPLQYQVKKLEAEPAMKVWDLASGGERQQIRAILLQKIATSKTLTPDQKVDYIRVMNAVK